MDCPPQENMARKLEDMVVVITGASSGIGRALAEYLSAKGAVNARRSKGRPP